MVDNGQRFFPSLRFRNIVDIGKIVSSPPLRSLVRDSLLWFATVYGIHALVPIGESEPIGFVIEVNRGTSHKSVPFTNDLIGFSAREWRKLPACEEKNASWKLTPRLKLDSYLSNGPKHLHIRFRT